MPSTLTLFLLLLLFLFISSPAGSDAASEQQHEPPELVRSSCLRARYPKLCLHTLSSYSGPAKTPKDIAQAAVGVSLSHARSVSDYLRTQVSTLAHRTRREQAALSDCVEQMSDSVDELSRTMGELRHLRVGGEPFQWQIANAQTWVSAALTDEDTCLDGFEGVDGEVKTGVHRKITSVARVTSNALSLINHLG